MPIAAVTPPALADVPLAPPFFLRKLKPGEAWGDYGTPHEVRLPQVLQAVFMSDPGSPSLFKVETSDDFRRILAANYATTSGRGHASFLPITPGEFDAAGITPRSQPGGTQCIAADRLDFEIDKSETHLRNLCESLLKSQRGRVQFKENLLAALVAAAQAHGCSGGMNTTGTCGLPVCA